MLIRATAVINFEEEWQYKAEFPVQSGSESEIGVNLSAVSNLSYNPDTILYSSMTQGPSSPSNRYFYVKDSDEATLIYNFKSGILDEYDEAGFTSFNYSQQGENPKNFIEADRTYVPVQTVATYDGTKLKRADFVKAKYIKYTLSLYKKTDSGGNVTYTPVSVYAYLGNDADSVFIKVNSGVTSAYASGAKMTADGSTGKLVYTAELDQASFTKADDQIIAANINFDIITGASFHDYANYRVVLNVGLFDNNWALVSENASAHDWVVYTNAKINPSMLTYSEAGQ